MRFLVLLPPLLVGCSDNAFTRSSSRDVFEQAPSNLVDILWVVDNSVSMENEQAQVAAGAQNFLDRLENTDIDFHLGVVTTDVSGGNADAGALLGSPSYVTADTPDYGALFAERVVVGVEGDDQERGLQAAITALSPPLSNTRNVGFLRDDALLSIIIVSDENDCSDFGALGASSTGEDCYTSYSDLVPVVDLVREFRALKEQPDRVQVSGIVGPEAVENCVDTVPGKRYYTAIAMLGGLRSDICQTDYGVVMDALGEVASGIRTSFLLEHVPDAETIVVTVDVPDVGEEEVPMDAASGWTYNEDDTAPAIEFHGDSVPPRGSEITVEYVILREIQVIVE